MMCQFRTCLGRRQATACLWSRQHSGSTGIAAAVILHRRPRLHHKSAASNTKRQLCGKGLVVTASAAASGPQENMNSSSGNQPDAMASFAQMEAAWVQAIALPPSERNKLLAKRMKAATAYDPVAYDLVKQDSKEFMMGAISATEFYDRFIAVFAMPAPPPEEGEDITQVTPTTDEAETWFKELALLIPAPGKRMQLLQQCSNPNMVPHPDYITAARQARAAAIAAAQAAQAAAATGAASNKETGMQTSDHASKRQRTDAPADSADAKEQQQGEEDIDEDEDADSDDEGGTIANEQIQDYEDAAGPDQREFKGWIQLDRKRMDALVEKLRQQERETSSTSAATNSSVQQTASTATDIQPGQPNGGRPAGTTFNSSSQTSSSPAVLLPGLAGVHFNSTTSRPARAMKGKKSGMQAVLGQAPVGAKNVVVWLRQDLRLTDNPALYEAARTANLLGGTVTLLYVHSPAEDGDDFRTGLSWRPSGAGLFWQQEALNAFNADVIAKFGPGAAVVMRHGPYEDAINEVATAVGAWYVFCNRRYEPAAAASDERVWTSLAARGYEINTFNGALLREPWDVKVDMRSWSGHFGTLTPFMKAWEKQPRIGMPFKEPKKLPVPKQSVVGVCNGTASSELSLYKPAVRADGSVVDWGASIKHAWDISERGALSALDTFLAAGLSQYEGKRQFADARAVSRLSPYLRFGQLSPRLVWQRLQDKQAKTISKTFYRRLLWRDLAYWQLHHWPNMATEPIRSHYRDVEWSWQADRLEAWKKGKTGFPLVDAGMRELWQTGWMQQSVRMVCAAFLTEYLNIHWLEGARWYHDTLVDADLAINSMMWQNAGKSGLDQWNFIMDPTSKAQDPDGSYIKKWVPELAKLPAAYVHQPWTAPPQALAAAGVELGVTYPHRLIQGDLRDARQQNVAAICAARALHQQEWIDPRGYDLVIAPKGSTTHIDGKKVVVFTKQEYRRALSTQIEDQHDDQDQDGEVGFDNDDAARQRVKQRRTVIAKAKNSNGHRTHRIGNNTTRQGGKLGNSRVHAIGTSQRTLDSFFQKSGRT